MKWIGRRRAPSAALPAYIVGASDWLAVDLAGPGHLRDKPALISPGPARPGVRILVTHLLPCVGVRLWEFVDAQGNSPFGRWFSRLDRHAAARVATALYRMEMGNLAAGGLRPCH